MSLDYLLRHVSRNAQGRYELNELTHSVSSCRDLLIIAQKERDISVDRHSEAIKEYEATLHGNYNPESSDYTDYIDTLVQTEQYDQAVLPSIPDPPDFRQVKYYTEVARSTLQRGFATLKNHRAFVTQELEEVRELSRQLSSPTKLDDLSTPLSRLNDINRWADFSFDLRIYDTFAHNFYTGDKLATLPVQIRHYRDNDLSHLIRIENNSFAYPWSRENFKDILKQRNCIALVAECGEQIAGYLFYEAHRNRMHILNVAVAPEFRRQDIASQLLERLLSRMRLLGFEMITTEVRESNLPALNFFKCSEFRAVTLLKNCYKECDEQGILLMRKR